jgi:hypothetical protein
VQCARRRAGRQAAGLLREPRRAGLSARALRRTLRLVRIGSDGCDGQSVGVAANSSSSGLAASSMARITSAHRLGLQGVRGVGHSADGHRRPARTRDLVASGLGQRSLEHVGQGGVVAPVRLCSCIQEQEPQAIEARGNGADPPRVVATAPVALPRRRAATRGAS